MVYNEYSNRKLFIKKGVGEMTYLNSWNIMDKAFLSILVGFAKSLSGGWRNPTDFIATVRYLHRIAKEKDAAKKNRNLYNLGPSLDAFMAQSNAEALLTEISELLNAGCLFLYTEEPSGLMYKGNQLWSAHRGIWYNYADEYELDIYDINWFFQSAWSTAEAWPIVVEYPSYALALRVAKESDYEDYVLCGFDGELIAVVRVKKIDGTEVPYYNHPAPDLIEAWKTLKLDTFMLADHS